MKIKTHVLTVSRVFPVTHKRKGELTFFVESILMEKKLHTIRANYWIWKKRIDEVNQGIAILSVRYWSGKPYNSKQVEICQFDKDSDIWVQRLVFKENKLLGEIAISPDRDVFHSYTISDISKNDGLSIEDFKEWFKNYELSKQMAIIHFTKFRY
jgi:hypothetical protein